MVPTAMWCWFCLSRSCHWSMFILVCSQAQGWAFVNASNVSRILTGHMLNPGQGRVWFSQPVCRRWQNLVSLCFTRWSAPIRNILVVWKSTCQWNSASVWLRTSTGNSSRGWKWYTSSCNSANEQGNWFDCDYCVRRKTRTFQRLTMRWYN